MSDKSQSLFEQLSEVINGVLATAGLGPVDKTIPPWGAWLAGAAAEFVYSALRIQREPPITRFVAHQLSTAHWFDIGAARRDLGYDPQVSFSQGLDQLRDSLQKQ